MFFKQAIVILFFMCCFWRNTPTCLPSSKSMNGNTGWMYSTKLTFLHRKLYANLKKSLCFFSEDGCEVKRFTY